MHRATDITNYLYLMSGFHVACHKNEILKELFRIHVKLKTFCSMFHVIFWQSARTFFQCNQRSQTSFRVYVTTFHERSLLHPKFFVPLYFLFRFALMWFFRTYRPLSYFSWFLFPGMRKAVKCLKYFDRTPSNNQLAQAVELQVGVNVKDRLRL